MADKYQRNLGWCEEGQTYCDVSEKAYKQGGKDAIDAYIEELLKHKTKDEYPVICMDEWTLKRLAEKMKGEAE